MERALSIERAAHFAGVSPDEIERLVSVGTLAEVEGKILIAELRRVYPEVDFTGSKMVDVVDQIKDDVVIKALRMKAGGGEIPIDPMRELQKLRRDVAYYRERADRFRALCYDLRGMLHELTDHVDQKHRVNNILHWLDQKMRKLR